jgi:hypothetical protein
MIANDVSWRDAVLHGNPGVLVRQLLAHLDSVENADQRAKARDEAVGHCLEACQNSHQLAVIMDLVFRTKHKEEFNAQLNTSNLCRELRQLSDAERARDKQRHSAEQRTACCTAVENWGHDFLCFASRHGWFDKKGMFWREARAASNRVSNWTVAKSMLDLTLLNFHLRVKDWEPVLEQGYLVMTRVSDLMKIVDGAQRLDNDIAGAFRLKFDDAGDISFDNWQEVSLAANLPSSSAQQSSEEDSPLSSYRSSVSPPMSPDDEQAVSNNVGQQQIPAASTSRASKGAVRKSTGSVTKRKKRKRKTHDSEQQRASRHQMAEEPQAFNLAHQPETEAYLQACGSVERDKHERRCSTTQALLRNSFNHMRNTLDQVRNSSSGQSMARRDELFIFAVTHLQSPSQALEWCSDLPKTLCDRADVLQLNDTEAMDLIDAQSIIGKPILIRGNQCQHPNRASWFFTSLLRERGLRSTLDVQGNGSEVVARPTTLQNLEACIFRPSFEAGSRDFEPINCLKVPLITSQEGDPPFMCHPRYLIGDEVCRRLREAAGNNCTASLLEDSRRFNLLSTVLTVSQFHKDAFNCTWVKCLAGVKAWFFLKTDAEQNYQDPSPRDLRVVLLFPGDVLFMPAGLPVPHAVVTVDGPCVMAGGQRLDAKCLLPQLNEILKTIRRPETTNEDLSLTEFSSILGDIIKQIRERPTEFDDPQDLASSISAMVSSL